MEHQQQPTPPSDFSRFMRSHTARFIIVGLITLVLLIPLTQIHFLIGERQMRQSDVLDELKTEWGEDVSYYGLAIRVPVYEAGKSTYYDKAKQEKVVETEQQRTLSFIYPEEARNEINTTVAERYRGIFSAPTFLAEINDRSRFRLDDLQLSPNQRVDWSQAQLVLVTNSDARFKEISAITVNGKQHAIESQEQDSHSFLLTATAPFAINPAVQKTLDVSVNAYINGTQQVRYQSLANKSSLKMRSNWNDPAFSGTSLPNSNALHITEKGFTSAWNNLEIGNGSGQIHPELSANTAKFSDIRFLKLVDHYQLNERTVKYGLLVLVLTFAVFFLIQVVGKVTVHPVHYFMIGLALLLFYTLLLSFSEQIGFLWAYIVAAGTIILLIVWYARSILHSLKFALMSGLSLTLLYTFLLVIVNLEVYALIVGSIGLLLVLIAIMSITRRINFDTAH